MTKWSEMEALREAFGHVARKAGAAGGDGQTTSQFAHGLEAKLMRLSTDIRDNNLQPGRHFIITKKKLSGGVRRISIPCVRDRVWQTALAWHLANLWDRRMADTSFAYRAGRSVEDAVARATVYRLRGYVFVAQADITTYFDRLRHGDMRMLIKQEGRCEWATNITTKWLKAYATEMTRFGMEKDHGIPQGSPLSPILANHILTNFDLAMNGKGLKLLRYADNILLMARGADEVKAGLRRVASLLATMGLRLNDEKTEFASLASAQVSMNFLGYAFQSDRLKRVG